MDMDIERYEEGGISRPSYRHKHRGVMAPDPHFNAGPRVRALWLGGGPWFFSVIPSNYTGKGKR
jgi:hypothetical protein